MTPTRPEPTWKLPAQIAQVRALHAQGLSLRQIAQRTGIYRTRVGRLLQRRTPGFGGTE